MRWRWYIILPIAFLIFHLGTRASIYFTVAPGTALWYWPIPLGLILIQWWGPKVLLPLYLNAVLSAGLWGLPQWQFWPIYALPETGQVFLSWLLFKRFYRGLSWLPDFRNQQRFLIWGIFVPSLIGNLWLQAQFLFLGDISQTNISLTFLTSWVADMLGNLVVALPALYFLTPSMEKIGLSLTNSDPRPSFGANLDLSSWLKIALLFGLIWYVSLWLPPQDYWFIYGIIILGVAFNVGLALIFAVNIWIICCVLFLPAFLPNLYYWHWLPLQNLSAVYLSLICLFTAGISVTRALEELRANMAHLSESESRFRLLAENSTDMISRHDTQGNYLYVSPSCRTLLGYEPEELVGHSAFEFIHPDDVPTIDQVRSNIIERPIDYTTLTRVRRKNGDYIWLESTGHTIFDQKTGNALEIHAASRDVSERKQFEDALYQRTHDLGERVKELNCLYRISELMGMAEKPLVEILQGMIELLPSAWQFPSVTCARLTLDGQIFRTANFEETLWKQTTEIILDGKTIGFLEVGYLEEQPVSDEGPFLKEERFLINVVAEHTGKIIERRRAEEQIHLLQSILIDISTIDDLSSTLEVVLRRVCERTGWVFGQAWLPRRDRSALDCSASWFSDVGLEKFRDISIQTTFSPGIGLPGRVWSSKQPAWLENATLDPNFLRADVAEQLGLKAVLALPILANGEVVGVIEFFLREQRTADEWRINVIGAVAAQLGLVMERKRAEEELRRAEELFRAVVEDQTEMIVRWKPDGTRTFVNQAYCRTFGKTYEEIVGTSFWPFVAEPFRERRLQWIRGLKPDSPYSTSVHVSLLPDGSTQWQEWADHGFFDEQGHLTELQSVGRDITERRRIEQEERQHAARRETLAEISQALANVGLDAQAVFDTIARYTAEHIGDSCTIRILSSDKQWFNLVAFHHPIPETEALLRPVYFTPMPANQEWFRQILETGKSVLQPVITEQQFNLLLPTETRRVAGQLRLHSTLIVPLRVEGQVIGTIALSRGDPDGPSYTPNDQVLLQELADRAGLTIQNVRLFEQVEGARDRMEALSHRLLEVQEAERRALTSELHDRVGQNLTGLSINLQNMKALLPDETAKTLATKFDDAQALVQDTTRQIRDIMAELHLPELEDYGLAAALETYAERAASRAHLELIADLPDLPTPLLPSNIRIALFRAAQEAISNVLKHAKATRLEVCLEQRNGRVCLIVGDNGQGFEPDALSQKKAQTWGLNIMRERIESIGGDVKIESRSGEGTRVTFEVGRPQ
jgi:PAS domain S-box-containing protein